MDKERYYVVCARIPAPPEQSFGHLVVDYETITRYSQKLGNFVRQPSVTLGKLKTDGVYRYSK